MIVTAVSLDLRVIAINYALKLLGHATRYLQVLSMCFWLTEIDESDWLGSRTDERGTSRGELDLASLQLGKSELRRVGQLASPHLDSRQHYCKTMKSVNSTCKNVTPWQNCATFSRLTEWVSK